MALQYVKDANGEDLLTDGSGVQQVMMEWEKPYMTHLVKALKPFGNVLEVGFGMGYSADAIQKYDIESYTIVEIDPNVLEYLQKWAKQQKVLPTILEGAWQKMIFSSAPPIYDCIFFDDYPSIDYPDPKDLRMFWMIEGMLRIINKPLKVTWFCTEASGIENNLQRLRGLYPLWSLDLECTRYKIQPSSNISNKGYLNPEEILERGEVWCPVVTITKNIG
jgi:hypothetical protein